jgi:hypothetical protein
MSSRRRSHSRKLSPPSASPVVENETRAFERPDLLPAKPLQISPSLQNPPSRSQTPSDIWQRIISNLFMLLLMATPFLFTWFNEELFEFNKMLFVYLMTAIIGGVWLARMVVQKRIIITRTWFDFPILIFVISQLLSTFFSIHPRTSIFGYYSRFHGGLLSTACYAILFYAAVSNLQAKMVPRLLKGTFVAALVVTFNG